MKNDCKDYTMETNEFFIDINLGKGYHLPFLESGLYKRYNQAVATWLVR